MVADRQKIARYYNAKVKLKVFHPGDLVLKKVEVSRYLGQKKLSSNWEGSYRIIEIIRSGAYWLKIFEEIAIPQTWNADNLKMYYQ